MNEAVRNAIVERRQAGAAMRLIARELGISRHSVQRVLAQVAAQRSGQDKLGNLPASPKHRPSLLDAYESVLRELLARYPDMTAVRLFEELRGRGFAGQYTIVRQRVGLLRPRPIQEPVLRFETTPGAQAQMDYGVYDIDFTQEGRRRVYLFNYVLAYSRRQYVRFVDAQDFLTTIREHARAFVHLQGVAATCLYDNQKVVVLRHDDEGPVYNPRFLAFATHYGFKPWACQRRRPQTKGKIEKGMHFVEVSLLNGRTFHTLDQLNEVAAWWLRNVADVRVHRETQQTPLARHAEELAQLIPLPAQPYDTACVVYRSVNAEFHRLPPELLCRSLALARLPLARAHHRARGPDLQSQRRRSRPARLAATHLHRPAASRRQSSGTGRSRRTLGHACRTLQRLRAGSAPLPGRPAGSAASG